MRRTKLLLTGAVLFALTAPGCSKQSAGPDAPTDDSGVTDAPDIPGNGGPLRVGAHGIHWYHLGADAERESSNSISTPRVTTQASGSTIVVSVGRGDNTLFELPTDSIGNTPYQQLGTMHKYTQWQTSGTALYAFPNARGGSNFRVRTTTNDHDEVTIAMVEIEGGRRIQDHSWREIVQPAQPVPVTSANVTTTGPATLVAFWWGDGFPRRPQDALPEVGFTRVEKNTQAEDSFVQSAVAVKNVTEAGTYNVTWTSDPVQGAQLWLVAVQ